MPTAPSFGRCKHAPPTAHISKSTLARTMSATTSNSRNPSHRSASSPRLRTGLVSCQLTDGIGLPVILAQVGVNEVNDIWPNGSLEHCRQSDIFARGLPLFGVYRNQRASTRHGGREKATLLSGRRQAQEKEVLGTAALYVTFHERPRPAPPQSRSGATENSSATLKIRKGLLLLAGRQTTAFVDSQS